MHVKVVFLDQSECRLWRIHLGRLAQAAKVRFPPILWKNKVLLAQKVEL